MFVPVHDDNPLKRIPFQWVTVSLIAANALVYLFLGAGLFIDADERGVAFALIPAELLSGNWLTSPTQVPEGAPPVPERWTFLSYMFLHGSFLHLAGNMAFLWVFGDNVEDAMGHLRFLLFYVMCGIFAALAHVAMLPASEAPLIGASGAVAGVIAAYLMLHPKVKVWVLAFYRIPIRITAAWALGFWVVLQLFNALTGNGDNVAWWAHLGGLAAGALLVPVMRRPGVPLFDRGTGKA